MIEAFLERRISNTSLCRGAEELLYDNDKVNKNGMIHGFGMYLDPKNSKHLLWAAVALTILSAVSYVALSRFSPANGLGVNGLPTHIGFMAALYFSITTETTLGYGDLVPLGFARLVACTQVICGLVLAGAAVARITALPGGKLRTVTHRAAGDWIEFAEIDGELIIALSTISFTGDVLRYDGDHFTSSGEPLGFFKGALLDIDESGTILKFSFSTKDSATTHYFGGQVTVRFSGSTIAGKWNRLLGSCNDERYGLSTYESIRASEAETAIIHAVSHAAEKARRELIRGRALAHFGVEKINEQNLRDGPV